MSELPRGWVETKLKRVVTLQNGRAYKRDELLLNGRYPVLRVGNFFTNQNCITQILTWMKESIATTEIFCMRGLHRLAQRYGMVESNFSLSYMARRCRRQMFGQELPFPVVEWDKENIKAEHGTGSTMIHVTKGDIGERQISLPPLAEQKRIVGKLDALSAKSARARDHLSRIEPSPNATNKPCSRRHFRES